MTPRRREPSTGLRIALVANWYAPFVGGAQIVVRNLARELARRHDVTVLTPRRDPESPQDELDEGVRVRRLAVAASPRRPVVDRKPWAPGILRELLGGRYDVAVAFPSLGPGASMTALAARLARFRSFLFVFDLVDYSRERLDVFPDPALVRRVLHPPGIRGVRRRRRFRAFDGVFVLSATEAEALSDVVPFCALLPVCVDLEEFPTQPTAPFLAAAPRFGCVGRITPHKGQDLALRAFSAARSGLGPGARLTIAGAVYDENFFERLAAARRELGLEREVDLLRDLPRPELLRLYEDCDAHLVPARFLSGGSIVQEAWAAGRPVVASERVDPSLVREGETGLLFRFPSADDLAARMRELAADRVTARRMGSAGRAEVERVFHYGRLARALELAWDRRAVRPLAFADARAVEELAWDGLAPPAQPQPVGPPSPVRADAAR